MKKMIWLALGIMALSFFDLMPFRGTDVGKLHPVEVIYISISNSSVLVQTDTGIVGQGEDIHSAIENVKQTTPGKVFLETANYLLVSQNAETLIPEMKEYLRLACQVCIYDGDDEIKGVGAYLENHPSKTTVQDVMNGESSIPVLEGKEGVFRLDGK